MDKQNNQLIIEEKNHMKKIIKEKFVEFSSVSTSHGYPNIFRTKYRSIKILWLFCLSIAIGVCLLLLIRGIKAYLEYGVITNIDVIDERPTLFPTITICELEKFQTEFAADLFRETYFKEYGKNLDDDIDNFNNTIYNKIYKLATAKAASPSFGDANRRKLGYIFNDWCSFNNDYSLCTYYDFKWNYDYTYGNCYKYNSGINASLSQLPLKYSYKAGYTYGLNIFSVISGSKNNYSRFNIQKYQGVVIFIHDSKHKPIISNGIQILAGTNVNIGMKKTLTHKSPYPYSDCKDLSSFSSDFYDILTKSNKSYRQIDCFDLLLQKQIINKCSCYDLQYSQLYNATPCLSYTQLTCAEMVYMDFWKNTRTDSYSSECPLECDSIQFDFTYSTSDFDPTGLYTYFKNKKTPTEDELAEFKKQIFSANIYFSELKYTEITQTPAMNIIDLFANIGGTLGLFVGISVLSFIEIIEFIMEVIIIYFEKRKKARK